MPTKKKPQKHKKVRTQTRMGRPPKIETAAELGQEIVAYIASCNKSFTFPTKSGLRIWLGIHRDTLHAWESGERGQDFSDAVKMAYATIEESWVQRLSRPQATGAIFYLKNAFKEEYRDRHETDLTSGGKELQFGWQTSSQSPTPPTVGKCLSYIDGLGKQLPH